MASPQAYQFCGTLSEEEFRVLYPVTSNIALAKMCGASQFLVYTRGHELGLTKQTKRGKKPTGMSFGRLTEQEFRALYPTMMNRDLARLCGLARRTVAIYGSRLGLRKNDELLDWIMREVKHGPQQRARFSATMTGRPGKKRGINWGLLSEEGFVRLFPTITNEELAALMGVAVGTVGGRGSLMGLKKSDGHMQRVVAMNHAPEVMAQWPQVQKGHAVSYVTRLALSDAHRGKTHTLAQRIKMRGIMRLRARRGPAHPWWRGGTTQDRCSSAYRAWRFDVLDRDNHTCQHCGYTGGIKGRPLHAHHIKEWATHPALRLVVDNGLTLCSPCHIAVHVRRRLAALAATRLAGTPPASSFSQLALF